MTKSVCIVGAGPSGLVAAKTLLHDVPRGSFRVTVFDAKSRIGGLWPTRKDENDGLVHPLMVANQSKHTVQFSDLAWEDTAPEFPRAWQVGRYLERYITEYPGADVKLGHKVVSTELQDGGSWKVQTDSANGSNTEIFDYLLVTTGFFGQPIWPDSIPKTAEVPIIHSSKYRDIKGLLSNTGGKGDKILVIGGQMSGIEIAGTIATHLSSATHSPDDKIIADTEKYSIHHVVQRPTWVFPLLTSPKVDASAPPFLPVDLPSYNLSLRPKPLTNSQGHISTDAARVFHGIYRSVLGTDQSDFSAEARVTDELLDEPSYLAMSTHYMDFVRSGLIKIHRGKVNTISDSNETTHATVSPSNEDIPDIAAVILATGFDPSPSLSFLPTSVLETLSHSSAHPNLPVALAFHGTHHPSLPTLGFVGFYRSPYWGVMEMQARFLAASWTSPPDASAYQQALETDDSIARTLTLRDDPRCSQFPMGDYAYLMSSFSSALSLPITPPLGKTPPLANGESMDILTPSRYLSPLATDAQKAHAHRNLAATHAAALSGLRHGRFVAGAVFRSLLGTWHLDRRLSSRLPSHPSGRFVGTAQFLLRDGTADGRESARANGDGDDGDAEWGMEYLYVEDGEFEAANGMKFRATRRYVWRYDERRDRLSVWFARTDDAMRADYLFHELEFLVPEAEGRGQKPGAKGWRARASHLCVEDLYDVHYEFGFRAVNLREWNLGYTVRGPQKDYSIDGVYRRV